MSAIQLFGLAADAGLEGRRGTAASCVSAEETGLPFSALTSSRSNIAASFHRAPDPFTRNFRLSPRLMTCGRSYRAFKARLQFVTVALEDFLTRFLGCMACCQTAFPGDWKTPLLPPSLLQSGGVRLALSCTVPGNRRGRTSEQAWREATPGRRAIMVILTN